MSIRKSRFYVFLVFIMFVNKIIIVTIILERSHLAISVTEDATSILSLETPFLDKISGEPTFYCFYDNNGRVPSWKFSNKRK